MRQKFDHLILDVYQLVAISNNDCKYNQLHVYTWNKVKEHFKLIFKL